MIKKIHDIVLEKNLRVKVHEITDCVSTERIFTENITRKF